jgi:hypothetical protein
MREEKTLIKLLRSLVELVATEADRNPEFAQKLDSILVNLPHRKASSSKKASVAPEHLPDLFTEVKNRSEIEFELWLRTFEVPVLRSLIKHHDLDASRRSRKWKDPEKLAHLISSQLRARSHRGAAFLNRENQAPSS